MSQIGYKYIKIYLSAPGIPSIHMGGISLFYACYLHKLPGSLPSIIFSMWRMQCEKSNMTFLRLRVSYKQKQKPKRYIPFLRLRVFGNIRKMKNPDFFYACGYVAAPTAETKREGTIILRLRVSSPKRYIALCGEFTFTAILTTH